MKKIDATNATTHASASDAPRDLVLYVEDEEENWQVTEMRLRKMYRLLWARTAEEACDLIREHGSDISAILMDIQLQGSPLDGVDLTRALRGKMPLVPECGELDPIAVPIIFVTAHAASASEPELLEAGGNKLITKPVNFTSLTLTLTNLHLNKVLPGRRPSATNAGR